jgi:chromosome segregation ATPase
LCRPASFPQDLTDLSAAKSSFIRHEVDIWGSLRSLRTSLAGATARLSQQGAEVADLRLLCADLRAEAAAARAEAAAAHAEVQRQQSEFDQVANERDQSRGRAAEAESRAGALAADLAVAQATASEQRARAGGMSRPFLVFVSACFLRLCLRPRVLAVRRARVRP